MVDLESNKNVNYWIFFVEKRSTYVGCYKDTGGHRVLPIDVLRFYAYVHMTPELCVQICSSWNYRYAALQKHRECFCGDMFNR